jgi:hypothetical protein
LRNEGLPKCELLKKNPHVKVQTSLLANILQPRLERLRLLHVNVDICLQRRSTNLELYPEVTRTAGKEAARPTCSRHD